MDNVEVWTAKSADELCAVEIPKLSMRDFRRLTIDLTENYLWSRMTDGEIIEKHQQRAKCHGLRVTDEQLQEVTQAWRDAYERDGKDLPAPIVPGREFEDPYIIPRRDKNYAGWFPRGTVSLVAGSSGMGKTTMLLYVLEDLRAGRPVLHHPPVKADYRIGLVDRTKKALEESLEDKGLETEAVLARAIDISHADGTAPKVLSRQIRRWCESGTYPDIVVVEGIDFWVRKINDFDTVYAFIKSLEKVAEDWGVAIIATAGSPKMKAKDNYTLTRDNILGTSAWGRTCSTIVYLSLVDGDNNGPRKVTVLPRTGREESMFFQFVEGKAVFSDVPPSPGLDSLNQGALERVRAAVAAVPPGQPVHLNAIPGKTESKTGHMRTLHEQGLVAKKGTRWIRK